MARSSGARKRGQRRAALELAALAGALLCGIAMVPSPAAAAVRFHGFNVVATPDHPFGTPQARRSLFRARKTGANMVAIIPFLWQPDPRSERIQRGNDMQDPMLRLAIRQARHAGFHVLVKPHVWIPDSWAGAIRPESESAWEMWFIRYRAEILQLAGIAAQEGADAFAIGTELKDTTQRPEWKEVIAAVRAVFPRTLLYVAHNVEEAESVPFWPDLDAIGVSLYPKLGTGGSRESRRAAMRSVAQRLDDLSIRMGRPVHVAEIGLRSAQGADEKPWESPEERMAAPDLGLQAEVLDDWLASLDRPSIEAVLVWRWFTDPAAGGPLDTDFTVQGKPAEGVLFCRWTAACRGL